jgi:hypothetical protein
VGTPFERRHSSIEIGICEADQGGQRVMGTHDLVPKGRLEMVDSREALSEELDVPAEALRHDIEVPTRLDRRSIDVLPQISERSVQMGEPLIHAGRTSIQDVQPLVDSVQPLVDPIEPLVDPVEPPVDVLPQMIERRLKLGIHDVILLQSRKDGMAVTGW